MAAEVASAYINLRELQQQLEVVKKECRFAGESVENYGSTL